MRARRLGVIGGSGLYDIAGLADVDRIEVETPWGPPSDALTIGALENLEIVFLARHGKGHVIPPSEINYRANIDALKRAGATDIVSISACGSFREDLAPGVFVIVDQFIDRTAGRASSFFGKGCVAHVSMADPVCPALADAIEASTKAAGVVHHRGGTYICIDGPQFSSRAESRLFKSWGADVIGMTNATEAKLAREAELPYASVAMVTDYDCWRDGEAVEVSHILGVMRTNTANAGRMLVELARRLGPERDPSPTGAERALDNAIITPPNARDRHLTAKLDAVAGRVLRR